MLSIIVAYDKCKTIGIENRLPWRIPKDLAYFKRLTTGKTVVMGRKTFESIGKPLPNRRNIVITRASNIAVEGIEKADSIEGAVRMAEETGEETFIIGGESIYRQVLPYVRRLYITYIDQCFEGDTYFPDFDLTEWKLVSDEKGVKDEKNPYDYSFLVYERD